MCVFYGSVSNSIPHVISEAFLDRVKRDFNEGYEPKSRPLCFFAMEMRARSMPPSTLNPFHSERVQNDYLLDAARPFNLPGNDVEPPIQDRSSVAAPRSLMHEAPTGKGRGSQTAGEMPMAMGPEKPAPGGKQTEGRLPGGESLGGHEVSVQDDDLQRALEVEMLDFLRGENSKLANEVAFLKDQLKLKSGVD